MDRSVVILNEDVLAHTLSEGEVRAYAVDKLGMQLPRDEAYLQLARQGLQAVLPSEWKPCQVPGEEGVFYFNFETGQSQWEHPCVTLFREKFESERKKEEAEGSPRREKEAEDDDPEPDYHAGHCERQRGHHQQQQQKQFPQQQRRQQRQQGELLDENLSAKERKRQVVEKMMAASNALVQKSKGKGLVSGSPAASPLADITVTNAAQAHNLKAAATESSQRHTSRRRRNRKARQQQNHSSSDSAVEPVIFVDGAAVSNLTVVRAQEVDSCPSTTSTAVQTHRAELSAPSSFFSEEEKQAAVNEAVEAFKTRTREEMARLLRERDTERKHHRTQLEKLQIDSDAAIDLVAGKLKGLQKQVVENDAAQLAGRRKLEGEVQQLSEQLSAARRQAVARQKTLADVRELAELKAKRCAIAEEETARVKHELAREQGRHQTVEAILAQERKAAVRLKQARSMRRHELNNLKKQLANKTLRIEGLQRDVADLRSDATAIFKILGLDKFDIAAGHQVHLDCVRRLIAKHTSTQSQLHNAHTQAEGLRLKCQAAEERALKAEQRLLKLEQEGCSPEEIREQELAVARLQGDIRSLCTDLEETRADRDGIQATLRETADKLAHVESLHVERDAELSKAKSSSDAAIEAQRVAEVGLASKEAELRGLDVRHHSLEAAIAEAYERVEVLESGSLALQAELDAAREEAVLERANAATNQEAAAKESRAELDKLRREFEQERNVEMANAAQRVETMVHAHEAELSAAANSAAAAQAALTAARVEMQREILKVRQSADQAVARALVEGEEAARAKSLVEAESVASEHAIAAENASAKLAALEKELSEARCELQVVQTNGLTERNKLQQELAKATSASSEAAAEWQARYQALEAALCLQQSEAAKDVQYLRTQVDAAEAAAANSVKKVKQQQEAIALLHEDFGVRISAATAAAVSEEAAAARKREQVAAAELEQGIRKKFEAQFNERVQRWECQMQQREQTLLRHEAAEQKAVAENEQLRRKLLEAERSASRVQQSIAPLSPPPSLPEDASPAQQGFQHRHKGCIAEWEVQIAAEEKLVESGRQYLAAQKRTLKEQQQRAKAASSKWKKARDELRQQQRSRSRRATGSVEHDTFAPRSKRVAKEREALNSERQRLNNAIRVLHRAEEALARRDERVKAAAETLRSLKRVRSKDCDDALVGKRSFSTPLVRRVMSNLLDQKAPRTSAPLQDAVHGLRNSRRAFVADLSVVVNEATVNTSVATQNHAILKLRSTDNPTVSVAIQGAVPVDDNLTLAGETLEDQGDATPIKDTITEIPFQQPHPVSWAKEQSSSREAHGIEYFRQRLNEFEDKTSVAASLYQQHCAWLSDVQGLLN